MSDLEDKDLTEREWYYNYLGIKTDLELMIKQILEPRNDETVARKQQRIEEYIRMNYPKEYNYWMNRSEYRI